MRCFSRTHGHRRARADPHAPERTETTHDNRTTEVKTLSRAHDRAGPANSVWSTKNVRVRLRFRLILVTFRRFFLRNLFLSLSSYLFCLPVFLSLSSVSSYCTFSFSCDKLTTATVRGPSATDGPAPSRRHRRAASLRTQRRASAIFRTTRIKLYRGAQNASTLIGCTFSPTSNAKFMEI